MGNLCFYRLHRLPFSIPIESIGQASVQELVQCESLANFRTRDSRFSIVGYFDRERANGRGNTKRRRSTTNKLKQRNRTSLFEKARQGRGSSLDNWTVTVAPAADIRIHSHACFSDATLFME